MASSSSQNNYAVPTATLSAARIAQDASLRGGLSHQLQKAGDQAGRFTVIIDAYQWYTTDDQLVSTKFMVWICLDNFSLG